MDDYLFENKLINKSEYYIDIASEQLHETPTLMMAVDMCKFIKITDQESKRLLEFFK